MLKMTRKEYEKTFVHGHYNSHPGYCCDCELIVHEDVEPDAEEQECPECNNPTLMGYETALCIGHIDITDLPLDPEDEEDEIDFDDDDIEYADEEEDDEY